MTNSGQGGTKHPGGRPLRFTSPEELEMAIQLYFDKCDPHIEEHMVASGVNANGETMFQTRKVLTEQRPYTMSGLARALGVDRGTILNYSKKQEFFSTVEAARHRCEEYAESQLFGPYANGAKFSLTNNYSSDTAPWREKQHVDHTSKDEPIPLLTGLAPSKLQVEDDNAPAADDGTPEDK